MGEKENACAQRPVGKNYEEEINMGTFDDANVDKDLLSQIFADEGDDGETDALLDEMLKDVEKEEVKKEEDTVAGEDPVQEELPLEEIAAEEPEQPAEKETAGEAVEDPAQQLHFETNTENDSVLKEAREIMDAERENGTVTICHSKTKNLSDVCRRADIIVVATGKRNTLTKDMVKQGAVVIDVGMNRNEEGKLCGDVDFENVKEVAGAITPVPGGVGPMTIAMLMKNCLTAAKYQ